MPTPGDEMARLTVITGEVHSVRASAVEMARRLGDDGHVVDVIAPEGVPDDLRSVGVPIHERTAPTSPPPPGGLALRGVHDRRREAVEILVDDDLVALLDDRDPDLVLIDAELSATVLNVLATDRRVALFTTFQGLHRDLTVPPAHTGLIPDPSNRSVRRRVLGRWARFFLGGELRWARTWLGGRGDSQRSRLRRLTRRLGLPADTLGRFQWLRPVGFPSLPVVEFNLAEFDLPRRDHPLQHLVGSMVSTPRTRDDVEFDDQTSELLTRVEEARDAGRSIVYSSFGSFATSYRTDLLQRVVDATITERSWQLVLGLGGIDEIPDGLTIPDDVITFAWAPQNRLLGLTDVAVIHGGHATVYECIEHGVPMVVLPMTLDQPGYAARVEFHGLGLAGDGTTTSRDTAAMVRALVSRVLDEPGFGDAATDMAAAAHAARGDGILESTVRELLTS
ncbi:MAG: nucleotide disphospho-sugar-binding domain-containing protein [Actinomycetota bacterium]